MNFDENLANLDPTERLEFDLNPLYGVEEQADKMLKSLRDDVFFIRWKQIAWQYSKQNSNGYSCKAVKAFMDSGTNKELLRNITSKVYERSQQPSRTTKNSSNKSDRIYFSSTKTCRKSSDELLDHIKQARVSWEQGILEELRAIVFEAKRPFLLLRDPSIGSRWLEQTSATSSNDTSVKFLFDSEDLMETILAIKNPNIKTAQNDRYPGAVKLSLQVAEHFELQQRFSELLCHYSQLGLDEIQTTTTGLRLMTIRHEEGEIIAAGGSMLDARKYLRRGCPPSLRFRLWRIACGLTDKPSPIEEQVFRRLRHDCDCMDLVTDELLMHDIQTVVDDPRFFVFEEEMKEVILSFSRDSYVRDNAVYEIHAPLLQMMGSECSEDTAAPPCGVQPYLGLATYFAPLCYIFQHRPSLYHVTRYLWCRLWCRLNVITADDGALLSLCRLFEMLLLRSAPRLFLHLISIGLQPIKVAFPWMQLAFVGLLEIEQLLHLWERLVGFMDINLLAIASVSIFLHRSEMLLRCNNETDAMTVLMEGSRLHIIPLIQAFLLRGSSSGGSGNS